MSEHSKNVKLGEIIQEFHLEILHNGTPVDPCRVIAQLGSAPAARSK